MLCKDVMNVIEAAYPRQYAMDWDNVGLLAGRDDKEVCRIYVALDVTDEVIENAVVHKADMLITHHPLIFSGMKRINNCDYIGNCVLRLIQNDISYYAMHTNYDVMGMAELSMKKLGIEKSEVLEVTCVEEYPDECGNKRIEGIGRIVELESEVTIKECCERVKNAFQLSTVRLYGNPDSRVKRIAICPGSGKSVIPVSLAKGADVLITGDIGHHEGIDSVAQGMAIIDAGHYGIEHIFIEDMKAYLEKSTKEIEVVAETVHHPFVMI